MEDKGKAIENLNNDPNKILFCIFDGYRGEQVSNFLQENFPMDMKKSFPFKDYFMDFDNLFRLLDEKIKLLNLPNVGSNGTIIYIEKKNGKRVLYSANAGNSRYVLVNRKGIIRMTYDDKIDVPKEFKRITKKGGVIYNEGLYGALTLSRSFGDWFFKNKGLIVDQHNKNRNS